ncbi:glutathione S-transferase 1-like [Mercenaria mercenaria]|uniref:glutathione S-transferase 1-like n=1 Tax=Mercenaria mercenaria TaxID=6596 RepID=UPI00234F5545|nr:glutathione S-transferase 1-like [Mercenaria mercenaria]
MVVYKLIYYDSRGSAEVIRLLLALVALPFEDVRYSQQGVKQWIQQYPGMTLPALEVDGEGPFCQRGAIARYVARQTGLLSGNDLDDLRINEVMEMSTEMHKRVFQMAGIIDVDKKRELMDTFRNKTMQRYLDFFEKRLTENRNGFLVGSKFTLGDVVIYDTLYLLDEFQFDPFKDRPLLREHSDKVAASPGIAKWLNDRPETTY